MNIVQALAQAATEIGAVGKKERNTHQGFNFRGIDTVVNATAPALHRAGVIIVPEVLEKETRESRTAKGSVMCNVYLTVAYTFYGPEMDKITATVAAESFDSGDKATAKAMSVALRTALLQVLGLPTDEPDPDTYSYERAPAENTRPGVGAEAIKNAGTVTELRALWAAATDTERAEIKTRVNDLEGAGK